MLNLYVDVQNVYNFQSENPPIYTNKNSNGVVQNDPNDSQRYILRQIETFSGTVLPTIGIMVKF